MGPYTSNLASRGWIYNIATALYAAASASGYVHPANLCIPHIFVSCVVQLVYCQRAMSPHDTTQLETTAKFTPMLTFEICSSLFFALNFGTEGGTPAQSWAFRACVIQGSQQLSVAALWYWGSALTASSNAGFSPAALFTSNPKVTGITTVIAAILWAVAAILYLGLPDYYRQQSGKIPSFYSALSVFTRVPKPLSVSPYHLLSKSMKWMTVLNSSLQRASTLIPPRALLTPHNPDRFRRKIVIWFLLAVLLQNYWLSAPYGRNWRYLWSSAHAPAWSILLLLLVFFIGIWTIALFILGNLSAQHSWLLPIFAIGTYKQFLSLSLIIP